MVTTIIETSEEIKLSQKRISFIYLYFNNKNNA
jgi:hypothetical protein